MPGSRWLWLPVVALLAAGCGDAARRTGGVEPVGLSPEGAANAPGEGAELIGEGTVLQTERGRPQLCLGAIETSLPPQCSGPEVRGWDWDSVPGEVSRGSTTWGGYVVVGTYDGSSFTLTRPAVPHEAYDGPPLAGVEDPPLTTPCAQPRGGWRVLDPGTTTEAALERTMRIARSLDGFADLWLDQSINPAYGTGRWQELNDPTRLVLDVRVTGDTGSAERRLRRTWGGALCVSQALRDHAELARVQRRLARTPGLLYSESAGDAVRLHVVHDDGSLQRRLDEECGRGVVAVSSALQPYAGSLPAPRG